MYILKVKLKILIPLTWKHRELKSELFFKIDKIVDHKTHFKSYKTVSRIEVYLVKSQN